MHLEEQIHIVEENWEDVKQKSKDFLSKVVYVEIQYFVEKKIVVVVVVVIVVIVVIVVVVLVVALEHSFFLPSKKL